MARDVAKRFDRNLWIELANAGFFAPLAGRAPARALLESLHGLARGSLDVPFTFTAVAHLMSMAALMRHGPAPLRDRLLPLMEGGAAIGAICNAETNAGTDIRNMSSRFAPGAHGRGVLDAKKPFVTNAPEASVLLVSAWRAETGKKPRIEVFCVEKDQPGVTQQPFPEVGGLWTGLTGRVEICGLELAPAERMLGSSGEGVVLLREAFDLERLMVPAVVAGALAGLLEDALAWTGKAEAFGKPLGSFQYVQEKVVTLYRAALNLGALIAQICAAGFDLRGPYPDLNKELAALKLAAAEDGLAAAIAYYEMYGASGYSQASPCQKMIRDLLAIKALGGTKELQKNAMYEDLMRATRDAAGAKLDEPKRQAS